MKSVQMILLASMLLAGCGEEEEEGAPAARSAAKPAGAAAAAQAPKPPGKQLAPMLHVEDRVSCPTPPATTACDPKAPACENSDVCLEAGNGWFCGPCPEREGIRHAFAPRDFLPTGTGLENRDPFQSFVVTQPGLAPETEPQQARDPAQMCTKPSQFQAPSYSVIDLQLVGIVSQGTQRKVLLLDNTQYGYIVRKGDCVGKEKAFVKEIGGNFVTFQLTPDPTNPNQREPSEHSKQLYTDPLLTTQQNQQDQARAAGSQAGSVIAPPPSVGPGKSAPTTGPNPSDSVPAPPK